jgi:hypothetical protein
MNKRTFGKRSLAILAAASLVLALAATVLADAPNPDNAVNVQVSGLTVTIDGTWQWTRNCNAGVIAAASSTDFRDVGFAVNWGDTAAAGNEVVPGLEVGTPTDNLVHQRDAAAQGTCSGTTTSSGSWGPISHTYTAAGTFDVCAVMYDIRMINTPLSGRGSTVAGGAGHSNDNSAEENSFQSGVQCVSATIVVTTPSTPESSIPESSIPESSVLAGTGSPAASQPDTAQSQDGVNPIPTIAFSMLMLASLATLAYANVKTVRNRS